jgi:hypothetical protein
MKNRSKELLPFIILFILFNNFFLFGKGMLAKYGLDHLVLIIANSLFFVLSIITYWMQKRALKNTNPNVYVRSVMGGMMIKMAVVVLAVAVYVIALQDSFSKMSVFAAMFLYLIYLGVEVKLATKLNTKKNG